MFMLYFLEKFLKLYVSQTKKDHQYLLLTVDISSYGVVLLNLLIIK